jgi:hypothetical protein
MATDLCLKKVQIRIVLRELYYRVYLQIQVLNTQIKLRPPAQHIH